MAGLKVFISSTCYDLALLRSQLRAFIKNMGYTPVMSDYEEVLYDPREHTHTSCINEVGNCDVLVLIIGARFGGKVSIEALNKVNFEALRNVGLDIEKLKNENDVSITQVEVLKAIENSIPIFTFIDKKVWHDHQVYEKNKNSEIIEKIVFPSIEKQEVAKYIFNFINFVRLRTKGNNIFTFEKGQDIEEILKKQWGSYFQRLLNEQRYKENEIKRMDILSEQFEDLKTAILSSLNDFDQREVVRGIVRYRGILNFLLALKSLAHSYISESKDDWEKVLNQAGIVEIVNVPFIKEKRISFSRTFLIKEDNTYFECRYSREMIDELSLSWENFITLRESSRKVIVEAIEEMQTPSGILRYRNEKINDTINDIFKETNSDMQCSITVTSKSDKDKNIVCCTL